MMKEPIPHPSGGAAVTDERPFWETPRDVTHEEAKEAAQRFINGNFKNDYERPRISIPANPARDDDLMLLSYIAQQSRRADPVREEMEQAPPKTASHPSRLYRKKPVVIEAAQFLNTPDAWRAVRKLAGNKIWLASNVYGFLAYIDTLEGRMTANEGDWIIKGIKGEFYPCKPDIFAATYEAVIAPTNEMGAERSGASPSSPTAGALSDSDRTKEESP